VLRKGKKFLLVVQSLVVCVVFCRSLSILFILLIIMSVVSLASDCPFDIFSSSFVTDTENVFVYTNIRGTIK
jgi:hypothetical protein